MKMREVGVVMDGMMGMGGWMFLWGFVALIILVLAALAIAWLVRSLISSGRPTQSGQDPAEGELRRRYAAGQIDRDEFQRRLDDLRGL